MVSSYMVYLVRVSMTAHARVLLTLARQVCDHVAKLGLEGISAESSHLIAQHESSRAREGVLLNLCSIVRNLYPNNPAACTTPVPLYS